MVPRASCGATYFLPNGSYSGTSARSSVVSIMRVLTPLVVITSHLGKPQLLGPESRDQEGATVFLVENESHWSN